MAKPVLTSELSPLDQIRLVEAEITRNVAAARAESVQTVLNARARAAHLKKQAAEVGTRKGQAQYQKIVASASDEEHNMVAAAHHQAEELRRNGLSQMEAAIQQVVHIVVDVKRPGETE